MRELNMVGTTLNFPEVFRQYNQLMIVNFAAFIVSVNKNIQLNKTFSRDRINVDSNESKEIIYSKNVKKTDSKMKKQKKSNQIENGSRYIIDNHNIRSRSKINYTIKNKEFECSVYGSGKCQKTNMSSIIMKHHSRLNQKNKSKIVVD